MFDQVARHLFKTYGTTTKKITIARLKHSFDIFANSYVKDGAPKLSSTMNEGGAEKNLYLELLKKAMGLSQHTLPLLIVAFIEKFKKADSESVKDYVKIGQQLKTELHKLLGDDGVLIYPTQPEIAPKHKTTILKLQNVSYASVFNILEVPITQCPLGLNRDGLPFGCQIIAGPFNDHLTLAMAKEIEAKFGGWIPPCKVDPKLRKSHDD